MGHSSNCTNQSASPTPRRVEPHWYALDRASAVEPELPPDPEVVERLGMLRREGRVVPSSEIHYSELRENPRHRLVVEAGAVIEELFACVFAPC